MSCVLGCNSAHFLHNEDEKQVDVAVQSIPDSLVLFGQITDCAKNNQPVPGALVKVFKCSDKKMIGICHTFSGCNGFYMLSVPKTTPQDKFIIMSTCGCLQKPICASCEPGCKCNSECKHC